MLITTQYTKDYKGKADLLAASVAKFWDGKFIPIEFEPEEVESYRPDWPKNREKYISMQAGEFLTRPEFADVPDDEVIICVDADTVMNRYMEGVEEDRINALLESCHFLSVQGAYPGTVLEQVCVNLGYNDDNGTRSYFHGVFFNEEFTASFLVGRKKHWQQLKMHYLASIIGIQYNCGHHAAGQMLINLICYKYFSVGILPKTFQCGAWYDGCTERDAQTAIFNHTK